MPEIQPMIKESQQHGELNEAQRRRLSVTCSYVDKLLREVEEILHEVASKSPFPRHVVDVTPAQTRVLEDHIRRIREQLLRALAWQNIAPEPSEIPATRAALTHLAFVDIAIEELKPSYMRGSGTVPDDVAEELNGVVHELRSVAQSMERYLRQELGTNLEARLKKLEHIGHDVALLQTIETVVTRHGLVEFRSRIASLASRLEDNNLEVALFGRVSSGKSSLLNALLDTDVLPVGVNPITAVPTRLRYGSTLRAEVAYASGRDDEVLLDEFRSLVSEAGNPGNQRNVVRAVVEIPSPRLRQGIVLVDTPGLGSLVRRGAAETMAYLPACDLAILLIDAGATLNDEDIGTLRLLYEGGIPAIVLLSKADLLADTDLGRVTGYIETQVQDELGLKVHVQPVSALSDHSGLLNWFFEQELLPRFNKARSLREASVARKIGALRESVIAALETLLQRGKRESLPSSNGKEIEATLRHISGEIGEQRTHLDQALLELGNAQRSFWRSWHKWQLLASVRARATGLTHRCSWSGLKMSFRNMWIALSPEHRLHYGTRSRGSGRSRAKSTGPRCQLRRRPTSLFEMRRDLRWLRLHIRLVQRSGDGWGAGLPVHSPAKAFGRHLAKCSKTNCTAMAGR